MALQPSLSKAEEIESVLDGIETAVKSYYKMSGWLLWSNEQVITVNIAQKISSKYRTRRRPLWVSLEALYQDIRTDANANNGPIPNVLQGNPRHDMVVWNGDLPWCVIEVKSFNGAKRSRTHDVRRIKSVLRSIIGQNTLRFGLFAFGSRFKKDSSYNETAEKILED